MQATATPSDRIGSLLTEVLEVLLEQDELGEVVGPRQLAARLPVPDVDIDAALARLLDEGTAELAGDGVRLSAAGRDRAMTVVRRHRLAERLLADVIGIEWWKVHREAERFDGVMSDDVEKRLLELLGDPGTCPHGNPIPGSRNQPSHPDAVRLDAAPAGPVLIVRITETLENDDEALRLLQDCGFIPGRSAEIKEHHDGWVLVAGTVQDAALPAHVAAHTYVAPR